jgi:hypothetical protein
MGTSARSCTATPTPLISTPLHPIDPPEAPVAGVGSFSPASSGGATSQRNEGCLRHRCYLQKSTSHSSSVNACVDYWNGAHPRCDSVSNCSQMRFFGACDMQCESEESMKMRLTLWGLDFGGRKSDEQMGN